MSKSAGLLISHMKIWNLHKDLSWRKYHTGCVLANCILIGGSIRNLMKKNKLLFTAFKNFILFIPGIMILINYITNKWKICKILQIACTYKLSYIFQWVFTIFKETTQRNLYLCKFLLTLSTWRFWTIATTCRGCICASNL